MYFSVIIPCFNEEEVVERNALKVLEYLEKALGPSGRNFELILVNDGSEDKTAGIIASLSEKSNKILVKNFEVNKGRGAAMKAGLELASGKYLMFMDADLSYEVEHIGAVLEEFDHDANLDVVIISPYMRGGKTGNIPFSRLALSRAANWLLSGFFSDKISTVTSMVRAYRGEIIREIPLYETGKELHLEILRKLILVGAKIKEIPGELIWKEDRNGRLNKRKVANSAGQHLLYAFLVKPTRFIGKVGFGFFLLGVYELFNVFRVFIRSFSYESGDIWRDIWLALSKTFAASPHTVVISAVSILLSVQIFSFLALFTVLRMQQEDLLRHILLFEKRDN